jgi:ribonucleoside-diphosphate reductase alpha chain
MPGERAARTFKFHIRYTDKQGQPAQVKGYLTAGLYPNGHVGEIFVKLDKQGSETSGFVDSWAIAVSMLLQRGVPLEDIIAKFRGVRFEPSGMTGNPDIPFCSSPVDYICRLLELKFIDPELAKDRSGGP